MNEMPPIELRTGMLVFSSDGDELGRIAELDSTCMKLDARMALDFWINRDMVNSTEFGVARLSLPKDAFNRRRELDMDEEHAGVHTHR